MNFEYIMEITYRVHVNAGCQEKIARAYRPTSIVGNQCDGQCVQGGGVLHPPPSGNPVSAPGNVM